mgnify:CR=1 FL=1
MRFPQDLTAERLARCIFECELSGPTNYDDQAYLDMLYDEREDRKEAGTWQTETDDEDNEASSGDSAAFPTARGSDATPTEGTGTPSSSSSPTLGLHQQAHGAPE